MDFITTVQKLWRLHRDSLIVVYFVFLTSLSIIYCVFDVDVFLFSLADPRTKFNGYLFNFFFINYLIISLVVRNIDVPLDSGLNFGDLMHNVFEDFFFLLSGI